MRRVLIAGTHSGCGKTTVTCAVLAALKARGTDVSAFKCGPDYIDPMFHREVLGIPSHNLDSFFCSDDTLKYLLMENSRGSDIAVIEGVMGYYDGADGRGSAFSVAQLTGTPVVIVIDCRGMSESIGAVMRGFLEYRSPCMIVGFVFNKLPEKLIPLAGKLCDELGTKYLGYFPKTDLTIESRHLGLVTANEITDIRQKLGKLGDIAEKCIDLDAIMALADNKFPEFRAPSFPQLNGDGPVVAVARDKAFCFIYDDNIRLLEKLGIVVRFFSPFTDKRLPENASGLILCGGYPELHSEELAANREMLDDIRSRIESGMPTIAECGGFMYLHDSFEDMDGNAHSGAGVIHGKAYRTPKLQRFGYITMTSGKDGLLCSSGDCIKAHEFHYFDSTDCGSDMTARKPDVRSWECVHMNDHLYAGFPHLYFYSDIGMAVRFAEACRKYMENGTNEDKDISAR